jgi:transposase-like protein
MGRRRRQVSAEFKIEAVRLIERGTPPHDVARELGIRGDLLRKWRRQFATAARPSEAFPG